MPNPLTTASLHPSVHPHSSHGTTRCDCCRASSSSPPPPPPSSSSTLHRNRLQLHSVTSCTVAATHTRRRLSTSFLPLSTAAEADLSTSVNPRDDRLQLSLKTTAATTNSFIALPSLASPPVGLAIAKSPRQRTSAGVDPLIPRSVSDTYIPGGKDTSSLQSLRFGAVEVALPSGCFNSSLLGGQGSTVRSVSEPDTSPRKRKNSDTRRAAVGSKRHHPPAAGRVANRTSGSARGVLRPISLAIMANMANRRRSASSSNVVSAQYSQDPYGNHDVAHDSGRSRMGEPDSTVDPPRAKDRREQDKKTMLSKALQKAHTAVLLDNAQNYEGAIEAYEDACRLLGQVLIRSAGEDDRRKLDAIRTTYTNRIEELHQINQEAAQKSPGKNLPMRPASEQSIMTQDTLPSRHSPELESRQSQPLVNGHISNTSRSSVIGFASQPPKMALPPTPQTRPMDISQQQIRGSMSNHLPLRAMNASPATFDSTERYLTVGSPFNPGYAPAPLSPRKHTAEAKDDLAQPPAQNGSSRVHGHSRENSNNSISWLDTIDESGGSSPDSSVRSLRKGGMHRKHMRLPSGDTEAEFDAALDAAVEAAYADGTESYEYDDAPLDYKGTTLSEPVKQMVDTERKRLSNRSQIIQQAHARTIQLSKSGQARHSKEMYNLSDDAEEEERILQEISKDFGFDFGLGSKSNMPRQSDSSEYSGGSTYHSSMSSSKTTAMTSLSTVTENQDRDSLSKNQNLPRLSEEGSQRDSTSLAEAPVNRRLSSSHVGSVRSRRMSGQNAKDLKIETSIPPRAKAHPVTAAPISQIKTDEPAVPRPLTAKSDTQILPDSTIKQPGRGPLTTPLMPPQTLVTQASPQTPDVPTTKDDALSPSTPAIGGILGGDIDSPRPGSASAMGGSTILKKNKSSLSLKNRALSLSSPDGSEASPATPLSTTFSALSTGSRKNHAYTSAGAPPTPGLPLAISEALSQSGQSNVNIFESDLHSPFAPGTPNPLIANAPIPLEPCPDSHLLRPYWLMRCFYQTIAHPRGGYLSTKLFVPRDVWRVKGVKLKAVDDKIINLDNLTAALHRLGLVDTFDADAVLEEMQYLELVLDQVQSVLSKKLGSDVSVQGIHSLFRDASTLNSGDGAPQDTSGGRTSSQSKSGLVSSWRKLRNKSSAVGLSNPPSSTSSFGSSNATLGGGSQELGTKDSLVMSTLPMTSLPNPRFAKRDLARLEVSGPHAGYMESLARFCDAVQVVDQIARQVEDPGLKHSSTTHVGLELSTRHASEFFGFYVCRFVLGDLTMLLDKFIKRGSEWVLV